MDEQVLDRTVIKLNKRDIQEGLEKLIEEQNKIMERINTEGVRSRKEDLITRVELIEKRDTIDYILNYYFGVQSFQFYRKGNTEVEIR